MSQIDKWMDSRHTYTDRQIDKRQTDRHIKSQEEIENKRERKKGGGGCLEV